MSKGIDATVELVAELERLSATSAVAASAPHDAALYRYLADGLAPQARLGFASHGEFLDLTDHLLTRLGIWWSPGAYSRLPVMTPWCVRDRSCRYDQGPESWGAPRADGYLRDDNSIIKKLPLPVRVTAPAGHPYSGQKPWRGFTACHIWRELTDGSLAGEDPWLYSFMPNLIWLPSWLAPLTDRHDSYVQGLLQRTSLAIFRNAFVEPEVHSFAERAWARLTSPPPGPSLPLDGLAFFDPEPAFFKRRVASVDKVVAGCAEIQRSGKLARKLICSRYTEGLPALSAVAVSRFAQDLTAYSEASERVSSRY